MIYDITLAVDYHYASPAGAARMVLRMLPQTMTGQRLITGLLEIDPRPDDRRDGYDFFGNAMTEVAFDAPLRELTVRFQGRVERYEAPMGMDLSCPLSVLAKELAEVNSIGPFSPHHFLGASERVRPFPAVEAFARETTAPQMSVLSAVQAISARLHKEFDFDPSATDVTTDPEVAFENRKGVCQDISHVMIAGLRSLGIPAGYVSGFLRTVPPEGQARLEGADAMHAWVRAWCGHEIGWVQIDPTNDMPAGRDHVIVAIGRDYSDVAPVKGSFRTAGEHETEHAVDVVPVE
ncbi:transglutaminase family protein [Pseudooceanicola sp. C21-150M6]|uniref:transglutaminase family protein n=1 Tax=Pseudooceanicola sp. C21-150M6 TaxID=3434355 RepID=UPI003D7FEBCE